MVIVVLVYIPESLTDPVPPLALAGTAVFGVMEKNRVPR